MADNSLGEPSSPLELKSKSRSRSICLEWDFLACLQFVLLVRSLQHTQTADRPPPWRMGGLEVKLPLLGGKTGNTGGQCMSLGMDTRFILASLFHADLLFSPK